MILTHLVQFSFLGGASAANVVPTPAPSPSTGSGGGSVSRIFGHYPEFSYDRKELKREIVKVAKKKKRIELRLQFAKGNEDLTRLLKSLNEAQEMLAMLMEKYRELLNRIRMRAHEEAEEEAEFMEMVTEIL